MKVDKNGKITADRLEEAYILLKKNIYYENNILIYLKKQIVDFEAEYNLRDASNRKKYFENLAENILNKDFFNKLLDRVNNKKVIKKLDEETNENEALKYNYIINCPIELHLISVLWIMLVGFQ